MMFTQILFTIILSAVGQNSSTFFYEKILTFTRSLRSGAPSGTQWRRFSTRSLGLKSSSGLGFSYDLSSWPTNLHGQVRRYLHHHCQPISDNCVSIHSKFQSKWNTHLRIYRQAITQANQGIDAGCTNLKEGQVTSICLDYYDNGMFSLLILDPLYSGCECLAIWCNGEYSQSKRYGKYS